MTDSCGRQMTYAEVAADMVRAHLAPDTWRPSTAYQCATFGCGEQSVMVRHHHFEGPNGPTVGFYGECEAHSAR